MSASGRIRIGTAGWAIPRAVAASFPSGGAALQRYASRFSAVEINSTFYRSHRVSTYERWARITPPDFRFSLKIPRTVTHQAKLVDCRDLLTSFLAEAAPLGEKLGALLVQLPPSLRYQPDIADGFLQTLRALAPQMPIALEPRHADWFGAEAQALLCAHHVARVAADPAVVPAAAAPGGWPQVQYFRLHGSPRMYRSSYECDALTDLARRLQAGGADEAWCMFDNTASGAATADAISLGEKFEPA